MESTAAIGALAALAQDSRLQVYRLLVQAGPEGVAASEIAGKLGIPANTLSFHLKTLNHADLVLSRQEGRFVYYSANYERMNALLGFLTEKLLRRTQLPADGRRTAQEESLMKRFHVHGFDSVRTEPRKAQEATCRCRDSAPGPQPRESA